MPPGLILMPTSQPEPGTRIPETLRLQLAEFRRQLWKIRIIEAAAVAITGMALSFLLLYGCDRLFPSPQWLRLTILLAGLSLLAGFAPYWIRRWVWKTRQETQLAQLIARHFPALGDRLLGVVELQHQQASNDSLSPRLREAAMAAVAAETSQRQLLSALPVTRHRIAGWLAVAMTSAVAVTLVITPTAARNALHRWLLPFSAVQRYTFTKLDHAPSHVIVAIGEAFDLTLKLDETSEQTPRTATARLGSQTNLTSTLDGGCYRFTFPGQQDPGTIEFHIGDLRHRVDIQPLPRPAVESVRTEIQYPKYLELPNKEITPSSGTISAVIGSTLRVKLGMNRPLATATCMLPLDLQTPSATHPVPLELRGNVASTPGIQVTEASFDLPFQWTDTLGLAGTPGFRLRSEATQDIAPTCYLQGIERSKILLPEETIEFEVVAEDDFRVKSTGIEWSGEFTRPTDETPAKGELTLANGQAHQGHLAAPAAFSPKALGISPQKITLRAWVEDQYPNRGRIRSQEVTLHVMTRNEHAQILKSRFDRQISELEDLARRELNLLEENQRLQALDGEQLQQSSSRDQIQKQQREEDETERRAAELTSRMEDLIKDTVRNGEIDKSTVRKMTEALATMQELSRNDVPGVQQHLAQANDPSSTPEASDQQIDQTVDSQKKVVEKMREAIQRANDANRKFEAGTFVKRLRKAADEQRSIAGALRERFTRILGLRAKQIDPADANRLDNVVAQQANTASDVRWIQEDLAHYFARTQIDAFRKVHDEMRESNIDTALETIRNSLTRNHSFTAAERSGDWADQLNAWATALEGDKGSEKSGGGDGEGASPEDEDFEFMLRVMKMVQSQQDLRARTRALEQMKRDQSVEPPTP